ncbi:MAG: hypothetical protein IJA72_01645 [Clostridia bacterium]|nr:hypothetical protein [Clostridia bacterium]
MTQHEIFIEDIEHCEDMMAVLATRQDIWQDRFLYWICKSIYDILKYIVKKENKK